MRCAFLLWVTLIASNFQHAKSPANAVRFTFAPVPTGPAWGHGKFDAGCEDPVRRHAPPGAARPELHAAVDGERLSFALANSGTEPVCLLSHVNTGEFDPLTIELTDKHGVVKAVWLAPPIRDHYFPSYAILAPHEAVTHEVDLAPLLRDFAPGLYEATLVYDSTGENALEGWRGVLISTMRLQIS